MDAEVKTSPLVVALYDCDHALLTKLVEVRNLSRPPGARKVSRSAVVRALIREAAMPAHGEQDGQGEAPQKREAP